MKRILQLFVTRWLARTPIGMVILGIGWLVMRKKRNAEAGKAQELRGRGRKSSNPYMWRGPATRNRR